MNIEELRTYCLAKPASNEGLPFGPDTLVIKVMNKVFAIIPLDTESACINLKCDPPRAVELREKYMQVQPGFHMNKKHWNTVETEDGLDHDLIREMIDHSYELVVAKLTKAQRQSLNELT